MHLHHPLWKGCTMLSYTPTNAGNEVTVVVVKQCAGWTQTVVYTLSSAWEGSAERAYRHWLSCNFWQGSTKHFKNKQNCTFQRLKLEWTTARICHLSKNLLLQYFNSSTAFPSLQSRPSLSEHHIPFLPFFCCICIADTSTKSSQGITNYIQKSLVLIFQFC